MEQVAPQNVAEAPFPDWETIAEQIRCPLCEYELRGLTDPRCPECGYEFRWEDLLDRKRRRHAYLFEHHPEHNWRSFSQTVVGGLAPWRFWNDLHAAQRPDLRRLWRYRSILALITWLPFAGAVLCSALAIGGQGTWSPGFTWLGISPLQLIRGLTIGKANYGTVLLELMFRRSAGSFIVLMTFVLLALPSLTAVPLSVFQATMRQARIEHHHVQRCIIYSFDVVLWPALAIFVLAISMFGFAVVGLRGPLLYTISQEALMWCLILTPPLVWLVMGVRLGFACRHYLRLKHAWAVAAATQVIVALLIFVLIVLVGHFIRY